VEKVQQVDSVVNKPRGFMGIWEVAQRIHDASWNQVRFVSGFDALFQAVKYQ
jgi:hypothetical protein